MGKLTQSVVISSIVLLCGSCAAYLGPHDFDMDEMTAPSLKNTKPISVKPHLVGIKKRAIPLAGVTVNEDEFTKVLV